MSRISDINPTKREYVFGSECIYIIIGRVRATDAFDKTRETGYVWFGGRRLEYDVL